MLLLEEFQDAVEELKDARDKGKHCKQHKALKKIVNMSPFLSEYFDILSKELTANNSLVMSKEQKCQQ